MATPKLNAQEEAVYQEIFTRVGKGAAGISAGDVVVCLRQSGLPDATLHKVWDLADSVGSGSQLDRAGFYVALRLVAVAQAGEEVSMDSINKGCALPKLGATTENLTSLAAPAPAPATPAAAAPAASNAPWAVTPAMLAKYDAVMKGLKMVDGKVTGPEARNVLVKTRLPQDTLVKIWDMADIDRDGALDREEFAVAMYLSYACIAGKPMPDKMPADLMPPSKRAGGGAAAAAPAAAATTTAPSPAAAAAEAKAPAPAPPSAASGPTWIVTPAEKKTYDAFFVKADKGNRGYVEGGDVMSIFRSSKLPDSVLAQIWGLVDVKSNGQLNSEQFALAMSLIARKVKGAEVPSALTPELMPPSLRTGAPAAAAAPAPAAAAAPATEAAPKAAAPAPVNTKAADDARAAADDARAAAAAAAEAAVAEAAAAKAASANAAAEAAAAEEAQKGAAAAKAELEAARQAKAGAEAKLAAAKQSADTEKATIMQLKAEIAATKTSVDSTNGELQAVETDLDKLRKQETDMRAALKAGKAQLQDLLVKLKTAKAEQAKIQASHSRLAQSKDKIDASLQQYSGAASKLGKSTGTPKGAAAASNGSADPFSGGGDAPPETHGMSFADYFGSPDPSPAPKGGAAASADPFASPASRGTKDPFSPFG